MPQSPAQPVETRWRLSAALLGVVAFVVAERLAHALDAPTPWNFVASAGAALVALTLGTLWLVPRAEPKR